MNPSASEILAAIDATPATEVIVLPNDTNVISSCEQAAALASKPVRVVPTTSLQAGLSAMVRFLPSKTAAENESAMVQGLATVATGEVTIASRDADMNGVHVRKGAWLGLAGGDAVACGEDFEHVAQAVAERLLSGEREVLTLLTGSEEPKLDELIRHLEKRHPGLEIEVHPGGQPHYPLLLSAE